MWTAYKVKREDIKPIQDRLASLWDKTPFRLLFFAKQKSEKVFCFHFFPLSLRPILRLCWLFSAEKVSTLISCWLKRWRRLMISVLLIMSRKWISTVWTLFPGSGVWTPVKSRLCLQSISSLKGKVFIWPFAQFFGLGHRLPRFKPPAARLWIFVELYTKLMYMPTTVGQS